MISNRMVLTEKSEEIYRLFNIFDCERKFILGKDCICVIQYDKNSYKQFFEFIFLFKKNELSKKNIKYFKEQSELKTQNRIGTLEYALESFIDGSDMNVIGDEYFAASFQMIYDTKQFVGLILLDKLDKFLNCTYEILKIKIIKSNFNYEQSDKNEKYVN